MSCKKILGLDLGVSSIGWALIKEENEKPNEIIGMGVRIIPLDKDESDEFSSGNKITKNQNRTSKRTARKGYYRYVLRRTALTAELKKHNMFDEQLFKISQLELWELRAKAVTEKISLKELGRVLYHLNQKRGYKSSRSEENADKKDTDYVAEVKNRYQLLKEEGKTIGQKFFEELSKNKHYRTKQQVFPREAYIEEFDAIMQKQKEFYTDVLTDALINHLRDDIIYFQRKLKSQKGLVSICEFEGFHVKNKDGKEIFTGPKVAHRSNPLFQVEKIWETINNISIKDKRNNEFPISLEQKQKIFEYLDNHEKLSQTELFKILEIKDKSGWFGNKMLSKGLQGNLTKIAIKNALNNDELAKKWLTFNLNIQPTGSKTYQYNPNTGEVIKEIEAKIVSEKCINEPLYQLWHTIYSISDIEECKNALIKKFGFDNATAERLAKIDFTKQSYGNKSLKAIRKILPYLMDGFKYSDAASIAGYNHSNSLTKDQVLARQLLDKIPLLQKNSLRQPVVEKILNQMIHIVNDIIDEKRGWVTKEEREKGLFEIRIELARELKQSKEERNETFKNINKIERENKEIEKRLQELGLRATRKNIIKYRLFNEINGEDKKVNAMCIYTGKTFSLTDALKGNEIDVEHIIPKSLLFDDSQSNKTLTFRWINQEKGDRTAYDYMASKGEAALNEYIERVNKLFKDGIIKKAKHDKLLMPGDKIPKDFIERQLRESQYIARKSREILTQVAKNVWSTSGSVTEYMRRLWGWDDVLMNLQMQRVKEIIPDPLAEGITEIVEWETHDGQKHQKEVIKDWTKRDDHRHHAIDALTIACTKQGYIQRINTLSAKATRDELYKAVSERKEEFRESLSLLDKYFISQRPFTTKEVENKAAEIIVSFKPGKKVATWGKRFIKKNGKRIKVQDHILVPRGPLSEESVYGKIKTIEKNKPVKYLFENPHLIFKPYIKELVEKRLAEHEGDTKKALGSLKKDPIYLDENKTIPLQYGTCYKEEYVLKYPLGYGQGYLFSGKEDDKKALKVIESIVDKKVKQIVKERIFPNNKFVPIKDSLNNLEKNPIYYDILKKIPIKTVRCFTGLSAVEPVKYNNDGQPIAFVKPGNNHHIAIYEDEHGNKIPHLCTFWHAVERKKYGIPVIIENPKEVWDKILNDKEKYPQSFLEKLPGDKWKIHQYFQTNEIFFIPNAEKNLKYSDCLYRLQKMSIIGNQINLWFRQIFETQIKDDKLSSKSLRFYNVQSIGALEKLKLQKIRVDRLGCIIK
ncbi:CRISPR-associated endonuclease Cas9 [Thermaurantimonas aggregans]|uniref:CRISPR-associated endonuclease Cas9 n=1 Tax=Thermaurantimonas aggregans TaxID=2173829 RepID=A0A401XME6_9FLAO|nr:type II CRISPR RNA-guided endonuclease Cas9 [Thermaurantimonas aggregans]GCD78174.1 CRISPR-associated endonuclease Cas9 [Thermaurantimonas aggregans]